MSSGLIHCQVAGAGDTSIIFVHGFGCALADWNAQVEHLSPRFKCISMDLPGHGSSPVAHENTMQTLADAVNQVKREAGTEHVVLVGHSLGTRVITDAYLQSPDKVIGLVFVDGRYYDGDPTEVLARMTALVDENGFSAFIERAFPGMFTQRSSPELREQITQRAMALDPVFGRAIFLESILWDCTHGRDKIAQIRVPVLLLQSTDIDVNRRQISMQPGMRTRYMDVVSELVPEADVKVVAGVGHFAALESPGEVSREIEEFVLRLSSNKPKVNTAPLWMTSSGPITIERQGSFFVAGRKVTAEGSYDGTESTFPSNSGQTFWVDHMYVQFQIPLNADKPPIVLVHGGGGTGRVWESTPDGREGYQTIFLRRGHPVYIVDAPRGGRSGFPSFNGDFGKLDETQQLVEARTSRPGREHGWTRWRLGPSYPEVYPQQAFPMNAVDSFFQHLRPLVSDDPNLIGNALVALFEKIGPAILVTHSNSGLWGWLAGARSPNVKAIVSYEPGVVFPTGAMPPPLPLFKGREVAGSPVSEHEFARLATIPIQVVFGDNIPAQPVADLPADKRRVQVIAAQLFAEMLNSWSGGSKASVQMLPDVGLRGNTHFMFSDLNNLQVADQLSAFLARHGLDAN